MELCESRHPNSLLNLFEDGLKLDPDAPAVRFDEATDVISTCSYAEVDADSNAVAEQLISLQTFDEVVCLSATPKKSILCIVIGILKSRSAFAFVDVKGAPKYNSRFIEKLKAKYMIIEEDEYDLCKRSMVCKVGQRVDCNVGVLLILEIQSTERQKFNFPEYPLAYCIETSGSTGLPKLVKVPHRCILMNVIDFRNRFNIAPSDIIFVASPLTFDPSVVDIFLALSRGASVLLVPEAIKLMPDKLIDILTSRNRVTVIQATPSFVKRFESDVIQTKLLSKDSSLKILGLGGEPCPAKQKLRSWKHQENKTQIYNVYGITEVSSWAMVHLVDLENNLLDVIPLGEPLLETEYEVLDSEGKFVTNSGFGHLYLGGPKRICFIGWEDESVLSKGPMRPTGDLVQVDENGRLFYVMRLDDQIKRNGKKISVKYVESMANSNNQIEDCKLLYEDETQTLLLAVILKKEIRDRSMEFIQSLKTNFSMTVPSHSCPDHIIAVEFFPLSHHGKVNKKILLEMCKLHISLPAGLQLSFEIIYSNILKLWKIYLGKDLSIEPTSNFVLLGGNSLNTIRLSNDIQSWLHNKELTHLVDKLLNTDLLTVCKYVHTAVVKHRSPEEQNNASNKDLIQDLLPKAQHGQITVNSNVGNVTLISRGNIETIPYMLGQHSLDCNTHISILPTWKLDTGKCVDASPFVIHSSVLGSVAYIGSHSHYLYAICIETGLLRWSFKTGDRIESTACSTSCGTYIFIGSYDQCLYCIDASHGIEKWRFKTGGMIKSSPIHDSANGCVYFGAYDHFLYAVQAESGECVWKTNISNGSIFSSPCISKDPHQIYTGTLDGKLACLCPESGKVLWKYNLDKPVFSSCRLVPAGICVGCVDNNIYCLSHSGQKLWEYATEEPVFSSPCVALSSINSGAIICGSHDKYLYCVSIDNGLLIWRTQLESHVYSTPYLTWVGKTREYVVIACSTDGTLYCLNANNGVVLAKYKFQGETFSSPVVINNLIMIGCRDNHVYSLRINLSEIYQ